MNEANKDENGQKDPLTLIIDYGNGVQKRFEQVPFKPSPFSEGMDLGVTDVLDTARFLRPGLTYSFEASGFDRGGREMGMIKSVDGIEAESTDQQWVISIDQKPVEELRRVNSGSVLKSNIPQVAPGSEITLRFKTNK